jgi:hypothetical protein
VICAASCRSDTWPRSSTATRRLPDTPRITLFVASYLDELTRHIDVVLLNTPLAFRRSRGHREGNRSASHDRSPDDAGDQSRRADARHCRRRGVRRHVWRVLVRGPAVGHARI